MILQIHTCMHKSSSVSLDGYAYSLDLFTTFLFSSTDFIQHSIIDSTLYYRLNTLLS